MFLRDQGPTEIGGFGITPANDLLLVEDVILVRQTCSPVTVEFDDAAVADYFDAQVDRGLKPEQFGRIWLHTHPGTSAAPSDTDEETFARVFGACQWGVMFILARGGETSARLKINAGPGCAVPLDVDVDYQRSFPASDENGWQSEYDACVRQGISRDHFLREVFPGMPHELITEFDQFNQFSDEGDLFEPPWPEDMSIHEDLLTSDFVI